MPRIFRFYILHCVIGFAVAGLFVAALLYLNVGNLWHLIKGSDIGLMAVTVFWVLNGIVFAGVQTAISVWAMAERRDNDGQGGTPVAALVPAPAKTDRGRIEPN